jgi:hypothetical protein
VRGRVTDAASGAPLAATLYVRSAAGAAAPVPFYASRGHGFYARPLAPGRNYSLVATMAGYADAVAQITVPVGGGGVVRDFALVAKP